MFRSVQKSSTKYLIKPVVYRSFRGPLRKKTLKISKSIRFSLKVDTVLRLCKTSKTISKTVFWGYQKSWLKYLIKPVEIWSFWSPKRKMASKMIKKALGFSLKVHGVLRLREMLKSIGPRAFWSVDRSWSKYLIKPVELWSFGSPNRKMASKMIKKH